MTGHGRRYEHVAVLMGGWSVEREVSLSSGTACAAALESAGYRVTRIDVARDIAAFEPPFPLFGRLVTALADYRRLAQRTDLPEVPEIPTLHLNEKSKAVPAIRARLGVGCGLLRE